MKVEQLNVIHFILDNDSLEFHKTHKKKNVVSRGCQICDKIMKRFSERVFYLFGPDIVLYAIF